MDNDRKVTTSNEIANPNQPLLLSFHDDFTRKIKSIVNQDEDKITIKSSYTIEESLELLDFLDKKAMDQKLSDKLKVSIEKIKLIMMRSFLISLNMGEITKKEESKESRSIIRIWVYRVLIGVGLIIPISEAFDSVSGLISSFIPGVADPVMAGICLGFGVISSLLFYSLEGQKLKSALNVSSASNARYLMKHYKDQIEVSSAINNSLLKAAALDHPHCNVNTINLAKRFNANLENDREKYFSKPAVEGRIAQACRYGLIGIGGILASGSALFLVKSVLVATAGIAFVTNPIGWGLLIVSALLGLLYYAVLQKKSVNGVFLSTTNSFNKLKDNLEEFNSNKRSNDLSLALTNMEERTAAKKQVADTASIIQKLSTENGQQSRIIQEQKITITTQATTINEKKPIPKPFYQKSISRLQDEEKPTKRVVYASSL